MADHKVRDEAVSHLCVPRTRNISSSTSDLAWPKNDNELRTTKNPKEKQKRGVSINSIRERENECKAW
jgi:hypothetical protein